MHRDLPTVTHETFAGCVHQLQGDGFGEVARVRKNNSETGEPTKVSCRAANGSPSPKCGAPRKAHRGVVRFRQADVSKPLLIVEEMVAKGCDVVVTVVGSLPCAKTDVSS